MLQYVKQPLAPFENLFGSKEPALVQGCLNSPQVLHAIIRS